MSTDLVAGIDTLVTQLQTLEYDGQPLRVWTRLEDVQPPGVWVALDSIDHFASTAEQKLVLFLVSGDLDEYRALKTLSPLLDLVLTLVSPTEATTVVGVASVGQQRALPALRVTTTLIPQ